MTYIPTQSQYSVMTNCGSISLQTPNTLTIHGWSSLVYMSNSCRNSKNKCSSLTKSDFTTTKVSGS